VVVAAGCAVLLAALPLALIINLAPGWEIGPVVAADAPEERPQQAGEAGMNDQVKPVIRWSNLISAATLEAEIRALKAKVDEDVTTKERFLDGGNKKARRHFSELAVLLAVSAEFGGKASFAESALIASGRFSKAASLCKVASAAAYAEATQAKADLATILAGGKLAGEPVKLDWAKVADRSPLMLRMGAIHADDLSRFLTDEATFATNRETARRGAELIAAFAAVLGKPGMPEVDESDYTEHVEELVAQARRLTRYAAANDFARTAETLRVIDVRCAKCHELWR
jgi:hypothetical protein